MGGQEEVNQSAGLVRTVSYMPKPRDEPTQAEEVGTLRPNKGCINGVTSFSVHYTRTGLAWLHPSLMYHIHTHTCDTHAELR